MNIFYNKSGIGDVLIIPIEDTEDRYSVRHHKYNDVVEVYHNETQEVLGYNIFNASRYQLVNEDVTQELTEELVEKINNVFEQNGFKKKLDVDLSPKFVVGYVKEKQQHENADKLSVCQVDVGDEVLQIVCGAPNVAEGQKVVVAKPGAVMPSGLIIKETELRGVASAGMICSAKELDLPNAPKEKGILVLDEGLVVGSAFEF